MIALLGFLGTLAYARYAEKEDKGVMDWITGVLALIGATLVLLAAVGIVRMPDLFTRMQAATKASTLGLGCLLAAAAIALADSSAVVRAAQYRSIRYADLAGVKPCYCEGSISDQSTALERHGRG